MTATGKSVRRVSGEGSVVPLEKPARTCRKWRLQVCVGKNPKTGKYEKRTRQFRGTKTAAKAALRNFALDVDAELDELDAGGVTFGEYAEQWLEDLRASNTVTAGTYTKYRKHARTAVKHMGDARLRYITKKDVRRFYADLMRPGGSLSGRALSGASANGVCMTFASIMKRAQEDGELDASPCAGVKLPRVDTREKEALSKDEAARLARLMMEGRPDAHKVAVLLALGCGLRRGEACGLRWRDIDLKGRTLKVSNTYSQARKADGTAERLKPPKSECSKRTIPLDGRLLSRIVEWKREQAAHFAKLGMRQTPESPVVSGLYGDFMRPTNLAKWWRKWSSDNGFPVTLHQLRHTFATRLVAAGVDFKTAMKLMGHADTAMLAKVYAHAVDENLEAATHAIGDDLFGAQEPLIIKANAAKSA